MANTRLRSITASRTPELRRAATRDPQTLRIDTAHDDLSGGSRTHGDRNPTTTMAAVVPGTTRTRRLSLSPTCPAGVNPRPANAKQRSSSIEVGHVTTRTANTQVSGMITFYGGPNMAECEPRLPSSGACGHDHARPETDKLTWLEPLPSHQGPKPAPLRHAGRVGGKRTRRATPAGYRAPPARILQPVFRRRGTLPIGTAGP
jgi:hypothetical protein